MVDAIVLQCGSAVATIYPDHGGRLGQIEFDGETYLRGPEGGAAELGWGYWGSYPLLPWSNRIPGGEFGFEGRVLRVPVSWEDGSALHGLAARTPWSVISASAAHVALSIDIDEGPYVVRGEQTFALTDRHLDQKVSVTNNAGDRVPVGLGIHPWFLVAPVRVPADSIWSGDGPMPDGAPTPVGLNEDLRAARLAPRMDRCYTDLTESVVDIGSLTLSWTGPVTQVVVFSDDPNFVCVEPVTMANDGFRLADEGNTGTGVVALDPGESLAVTYRFARYTPS